MAPRNQMDRAELEVALRAHYEELEKMRNSEMLLSNMTAEEMHASLDPSIVVPPRPAPIPGPCECYICIYQFRTVAQQEQLRMTYASILSDSEAQELVDGYMETIDSCLAKLRGQVAKHGKTISSRWRKKSRDKRAACLLAAAPDLEQKQWIIPRFLKEHQAYGWRQARPLRKTWLLYWLDVESLKKDPARLLGLVHNRARFSPEQWAPHDNETLGWAFHMGFLEVKFSELCVVMHGDEYGKLVKWEKDAAHRLDTIGFPRAQLVLETQATLLAFLCDVVEQLVEGLEASSPDSAFDTTGQLKIPRVELKQSGHVEMWSAYINHPFSEPPRFDIDTLISSARVGLQEWGDHVWLLQTDPSYFRQVIRSAVSVFPIEKDIKVKEQPAYIHAFMEITADFGNYTWWKWTLEDCENIKRLQEQYTDEIQPGKDLPLEYDIAIQSLENCVYQLIDKFEKILQDSFPQRSGFRELFMFRKHGGEIQWRLKNGKRRDTFWDGKYFEDETLYWCLANLVDPPTDRIKLPPSMIFAFMDEYLTTAPKEESARMDERLYSQLSFYASLHELHSAIKVHRPGTHTKMKTTELFAQSKSNHFKFTNPDSLKKTLEKKLGKTGGLIPMLEEFLNAYDSTLDGSKKTTEELLVRFDRVNNSMDRMWDRITEINDEAMKLGTLSPELVALSMENFDARLQDEFKADLKIQRQRIIDGNKKERVAEIPPVQTEWGTSHQLPLRSSGEIQAPKTKSRPDIPVAIPTPETQSTSTTEPTPLPPISVKQQAFTVLSGMFTSDPELVSKIVDWDAFVNAMGEAGFGASQGSGSAVIFESVDEERGWKGRKIVFHKPHPVAKIDSVRMRAMGKRMERWFGWGSETFFVL